MQERWCIQQGRWWERCNSFAATFLSWVPGEPTPTAPGGLCSGQRLLWAPVLTGLFPSSLQNDLQHHWGQMGKRLQLIPTAPEFQLLPSECSQAAPLEVVHALALTQWPTGYLQGRNLRVWAQFNQSWDNFQWQKVRSYSFSSCFIWTSFHLNYFFRNGKECTMRKRKMEIAYNKMWRYYLSLDREGKCES